MEYKIKELREKKRMSQAELSQLSGVSRATIIRIESADNVVINTQTLERLAKALNVSIKTLFLP
ncbi:MAG: helix-turn-helix transcriptional regulator [Clostridiales bacterium]|nr:helix-turn-helix transcriptional regulator [Clostridiales bacterium]MBQ1572614.1 helix-turn-helix transcriptional regulator [Clostridiales bacterium]